MNDIIMKIKVIATKTWTVGVYGPGSPHRESPKDAEGRAEEGGDEAGKNEPQPPSDSLSLTPQVLAAHDA